MDRFSDNECLVNKYRDGQHCERYNEYYPAYEAEEFEGEKTYVFEKCGGDWIWVCLETGDCNHSLGEWDEFNMYEMGTGDSDEEFNRRIEDLIIANAETLAMKPGALEAVQSLMIKQEEMIRKAA